MGIPHINELPDRLSHAAPWWIGLGVTGVAVAVLTGKAPLLASLALIGIGSDADLGRRLHEAMESDSEGLSKAPNPELVAGFVRRLHAGMDLILVAFAWASLLHLAGESVDARWWLAGDLAASALLALGYARVARRHG